MRWTRVIGVSGVLAWGCAGDRPEFANRRVPADAAAKPEEAGKGAHSSEVNEAGNPRTEGGKESGASAEQSPEAGARSQVELPTFSDEARDSMAPVSEAASPGTSDSTQTTLSDSSSDLDAGGTAGCGQLDEMCCPDNECVDDLVCRDDVCAEDSEKAVSIVLQTTGLTGVVVVLINAVEHTITENGDSELELQLAVGDLIEGQIDTKPPGQRCLLNEEAAILEQYLNEQVVIAVTCADDDAGLESLTSSVPGLDFESDTLTYEQSAPFSRFEARFSLEPKQETALVTIEGEAVTPGQEIILSLPVGERSIQIEVEAQSGRTQTYAVNIERAAELEFVERLVTDEEESIGFGARLDIDGDRFAVSTSGSLGASLAAVTIFDFDSFTSQRHFGGLDPMDSNPPNFSFDGGHVVFTNGDYHSMAMWSAGSWAESDSVPIEWDYASWGNAVLAKGSISGNTMVLGGISVQIVYEFEEGTWTEKQRLYALTGDDSSLEDGAYANPLFLEIQGDTLVVGGNVTSNNAEVTGGNVRIYQRIDGEFQLALSPTVVPTGIAVGKNVIAIGDGGYSDVYQLSAGEWQYKRAIDVSRPLWIAGSQLVAGVGEEVTVRPWNTRDDTQAATVTRANTPSTATCATLAESAAMSDRGLLVGGCGEVLVFE